MLDIISINMKYFCEQEKMNKINKIKFIKLTKYEYKLLKKFILILIWRENILTLYKKNIAQKSLINYCITIDNKNNENGYT